MSYNTVASDEVIEKTVAALRANGVEVFIVADAAAAKAKALEIIPAGAEVMTNTSATLQAIGLADELNESGKYDSVRKKVAAMDEKKDAGKKRRLGAAPVWATGSVHAVTEDGKVIIASASGSQLPGYANGAAHVLWVVGGQKIVKDLDDGMKRIEEYVFPLENERAMKAYGMGSSINKLFILNKERPGRITMILVKEALGF